MSLGKSLGQRWLRSTVALGLALVVASLGGGCDPEDASSEELYARSLGDAGLYEFELTGDTLTEGANDLTIHVYLDGAPVNDVSVIARTVMPAMGHPTSEVAVDADESGDYEANVIFSMPGLWDVEIELGDEPSDSVVFRVEVQ